MQTYYVFQNGDDLFARTEQEWVGCGQPIPHWNGLASGRADAIRRYLAQTMVAAA